MKKQKIIALVIMFSVILIIPIIIYVYYFWNIEISKNTNKWADFGSYFGGILSPIIALFSTIILGLLTYELSKNNSNENLNLFKLQQKILAYQEIAIMTTEFDKAENNVNIYNDLMVKLESVGERPLAAEQYIKAMECLMISVSALSIKISNFPINYGHLFKYDFESQKYQKLNNKTSEYYNSMKISENFNKENLNFTQDDLMREFKTFLEELKKEINN
jgi:uncharacterized membrane protein